MLKDLIKYSGVDIYELVIFFNIFCFLELKDMDFEVFE